MSEPLHRHSLGLFSWLAKICRKSITIFASLAALISIGCNSEENSKEDDLSNYRRWRDGVSLVEAKTPEEMWSQFENALSAFQRDENRYYRQIFKWTTVQAIELLSEKKSLYQPAVPCRNLNFHQRAVNQAKVLLPVAEKELKKSTADRGTWEGRLGIIRQVAAAQPLAKGDAIEDMVKVIGTEAYRLEQKRAAKAYLEFFCKQALNLGVQGIKSIEELIKYSAPRENR